MLKGVICMTRYFLKTGSLLPANESFMEDQKAEPVINVSGTICAINPKILGISKINNAYLFAIKRCILFPSNFIARKRESQLSGNHPSLPG